LLLSGTMEFYRRSTNSRCPINRITTEFMRRAKPGRNIRPAWSPRRCRIGLHTRLPRRQNAFGARQAVHDPPRQAPDERMSQPVGKRPVIRERPVVGHAARPHRLGECWDGLVSHIEQHVAAVPARDLRVIANQWTQIIDGRVAALAKNLPPVAERPLIEVVFAALARHGSREQHL